MISDTVNPVSNILLKKSKIRTDYEVFATHTCNSPQPTCGFCALSSSTGRFSRVTIDFIRTVCYESVSGYSERTPWKRTGFTSGVQRVNQCYLPCGGFPTNVPDGVFVLFGF